MKSAIGTQALDFKSPTGHKIELPPSKGVEEGSIEGSGTMQSRYKPDW